MNSNDDISSSPGAAAPIEPPVPTPPVAAQLAPDSALERVAREMLRQQRSERRWRVFFRMAWFGLALATAWATSISSPAKSSRPRKSSTTRRATTSPNGWPSASALPSVPAP